MEIREYTRDEFNKFIEQNNLESFNSNQVDAFSHDVVEKSKKGELDEFETYCAAAEYVMLEKAIVVENDLTKSLIYYRPTQVETVVPDGIFKSINDKSSLRYKETPLNILKGIAGINCADEDAIEKSKALPIGTEKTYGGKVYIKTAQGWRLKKKTSSAKESNEEKDRAERSKVNEERGKDFWNKTNQSEKKEADVKSDKKEQKSTSKGSAASSVSEYNGKIGNSDDTSKLKTLSEKYSNSGNVEKEHLFFNASKLAQRCNDENVSKLIDANKKAKEKGIKLANYDLNNTIIEYNRLKSEIDNASTPEEKKQLQGVLDRAEKFLGKVKAEIPDIYKDELKQAKKNEAKQAKKRAEFESFMRDQKNKNNE